MRRHKLNRLRKFELLEDRRMKAGDIDFDSDTGVLTISGAGYNDTAVISFEGDEVHVDLDAGLSGGGTDPHHRDEDIEDVTRIVFYGFAGEDTVQVDVNSLDSDVTLDNITLEFHGGDSNDRLTQTGGGIRTVANGDAGYNELQGSQYNDTLNGGADTDILEGGAGDDTMDGGAGSDIYVFSGSNLGTDEIREAANVDNWDELDFRNFSHGVTVDLAIASTSTTNPQYAVNSSDLKLKLSTNTGIEMVEGSEYGDVIRGNDRSNGFYGHGGRDTLEGRAGNDFLYGGSESDTYVFAGSNLGTDKIDEASNSDNDALDFTGMTHGLRIDLSKIYSVTNQNYAVNSTDLKLGLNFDTAIETVYGTDYDDVILGNSRENYLFGGRGVDSLQGMDGVDELHGGADNDILYADSKDLAYGDAGDDWISGYRESTSRTNHRPGFNKDWGLF